jgi:hypothetical protein
MADSLPDIKLPTNIWVDLYAASGIAVGTKVNIHNKGASRVTIAVSAVEPVSIELGVFLAPVGSGAPSIPLQNDGGDSGLWAYSQSGGSVNIEVA